MGTAVFGAPEFKARSGRTVRSNEDGSVTFEGVRGYIAPEQVFDAQEFFQAQRDIERGWWRWPANPDWVAIEGERQPYGRTVVVVHEATLDRYWLNDHVLELGGSTETEYQAARAYFEAHPERKPWHVAKEGEGWLLTADGSEMLATVEGTNFWVGASMWPMADEGITAGRRIWPEDAS